MSIKPDDGTDFGFCLESFFPDDRKVRVQAYDIYGNPVIIPPGVPISQAMMEIYAGTRLGEVREPQQIINSVESTPVISVSEKKQRRSLMEVVGRFVDLFKNLGK